MFLGLVNTLYLLTILLMLYKALKFNGIYVKNKVENMKVPIFITILLAFTLNISGQSVQNVEPNSFGGYDYYDDENNLTGHSESDGSGGYIYYDDSGNEVGSITPSGDGRYAIYDAYGVESGSLESLPTDKYRYQSSFEGTYTEVEPLPGDYDDIATINPNDLFQE